MHEAFGGLASEGKTTARGGVTLRGRIEARGKRVTWRFQFGSSTTYDNDTRLVQLDSTLGAAGVSSTLVHLRPGTLSHARLVVTTVGSNAPTVTAYGRDLTFKTEPRQMIASRDRGGFS